MAAAGRTLHVRCGTWEQVETFYTRKLRRGKLLSMKVPFAADVGAVVTLGLELPNQVVVAIEGKIDKASPIDGEAKTWIEIELNLTDEILGRIKNMAAGVVAPAPVPVATPMRASSPIPVVAAPVPVATPMRASSPIPVIAAPPPPAAPVIAPPPQKPPPIPPRPQAARPPAAAAPAPMFPPIEELPTDERQLFQHLTAELRRIRQLAVHEVLGVDRDADPNVIRAGWMHLMRKHHPDLVARHAAPAITHLAEELTILCNRAYDRLRVALVAEGRATSIGSVLQQPAGWLVGFEDISSADLAANRVAKAAQVAGNAPSAEPPPVVAPPAPPPAPTIPPSTSGQGAEQFEQRARSMLGDGQSDSAQEVLAAALCVYPRSRPLRSLYYVASAMAALESGELMLATSQLETALAHYEQCVEAAQILEHVRRHGASRSDEMRRLFR